MSVRGKTLLLPVIGLAAAGWLAARAAPEGVLKAGAEAAAVMRANNRGAALMERFSQAQAAEEFTTVTRLAPGWAPGFANLGLAELYARRPEAAEQAFREAIRLDDRLIQGHYGLALVMKNAGKSREAVAELERARALDPEDPDILYNLGLLQARQRHFDEAVALLKRAREIDPNSVAIRYQLARALLQSGQNEAGEREMAAYQKLTENSAFAVPTGNQYGEAGRYGLVLTDYAAFGGPPPPPPPLAIRFVDATADSGITFTHGGPGGEPGPLSGAKGSAARATAMARYGSGVAIGDLDGDGRPDLVFANASADGKARPALYRNTGGLHFEDVTARSKVAYRGIGTSATLADFDNDGDLDLYLAGAGGGRLYANRGDGIFDDVTASAGAGLSGFVLGVSWADVDHDGDLDLYASRLPIPGEGGSGAVLLLNKGDKTFRDATAALGLGGPPGGSIGSVFSDLDNDRDIDVAVSAAGGRDALLDNRRESGFTDRGKEAGLSDRGAGRGLSIGDVDGDGLPDLLFAGGSGPTRLFLNGPQHRFTERSIDKPSGAVDFGSVLFDADNDGDLDLFLAGSATLLFVNDGSGVFRDATASTGLDRIAVRDGRGAATADLDGDGDLDLVVTRNGGRPILLRNDGGNRNTWMLIDPRGLNSNKEGIGAKVEVQSGAFWQRREVQAGSGYLSLSPAPVHVGMRDRTLADVVRLLWPSGVLQAELDVPAKQTVQEAELDRKGSSCPLLFAWNGGRFGFVTDFLGVGGLGLWLAPGRYGAPDPDEYVKIEPGQLAPRDGGYLLQVVENLEEVTYLDQAKLEAIDHPKTIDVFPNEQFGAAEPAPHRLFAVERASRIFPLRARTSGGRDATDEVRNIDRTYPDDFRLHTLAGYADMHYLDLEFPEQVTKMDGLVLFLYGWVDYEYSSSNYAAHQSGLSLVAPVLEVEGEDGLFHPRLDPMGFPPGLPRMMTVDLSATGPLPTRNLRLRTNMRIYWDQIFLARPLSEEDASKVLTVTDVPLSGAHLHRRGYPREHSPDGREPKIYDYAIMDNTQPFKVMTGDYTRFGRVTELLADADDRFVIFGKGEEVTLEFASKDLPPLPRTSTRSFLLHANGYCKDMDPHTAFPDTVEPLPFHGMSGYPYGEDEHYPDDEVHRSYRRTYNTRRLEGR